MEALRRMSDRCASHNYWYVLFQNMVLEYFLFSRPQADIEMVQPIPNDLNDIPSANRIAAPTERVTFHVRFLTGVLKE